MLQNLSASLFLGRELRYREQMQVSLQVNITIFLSTKLIEPFGVNFNQESIRTTGNKSKHVKPSSAFMSSCSWYSNCPAQPNIYQLSSVLQDAFEREKAVQLMGSGAFPIARLKHSQDKDSSPEASVTRAQAMHTALCRPVLTSQQTWRSTHFHRHNFLLLWDLKEVFFPMTLGFCFYFMGMFCMVS